MQRLIPFLVFILFICLSTSTAFCKPKYFFKIASIAPEGSVWIDQFNEFSKEVSEKTGGEVGFRIYPGGVMGDDQAMYRKMRVGQLHGGGFTMTGIADLVPDFRVLSLPLLFNNYDEVDAVAKTLTPYYQAQFAKKRLEFLAYNEVGFVYAMSTKPIVTLDDLRNSKNWTPAGDPLTEIFMDALGITPIQLTIPDVLSSLQTGLIDTVFNSLYGTIVLQWFTKAKYVTETPYGYAYGTFVLDKKAFDKLPEGHQEIVRKAATTHFDIIREKTRKSNLDSRKVLQDQGIEFVETAPGVVEEMQKHRDEAVKDMIGKAFSKDVYGKVMENLEEIRQN